MRVTERPGFDWWVTIRSGPTCPRVAPHGSARYPTDEPAQRSPDTPPPDAPPPRPADAADSGRLRSRRAEAGETASGLRLRPAEPDSGSAASGRQDPRRGRRLTPRGRTGPDPATPPTPPAGRGRAEPDADRPAAGDPARRRAAADTRLAREQEP